MKNETELISTNQEKYFFETFPLIEKITSNHIRLCEVIDSEDISQDVKLSLLIWKGNRPNQQFTQEEWLRFVNRVTHNRIKAVRRDQLQNTISLFEVEENQICLLAREKSQIPQNEGNTTMELHLLMSQMWDVIQIQTRLELYALLLKNADLFSSLLYYRGCRVSEMTEKLQLTEIELRGIIKLLPLSDKQIALFLFERFEMKATPAAIRKARQRATDELQTAIKEKRQTKNGKPSEYGKT